MHELQRAGHALVEAVRPLEPAPAILELRRRQSRAVAAGAVAAKVNAGVAGVGAAGAVAPNVGVVATAGAGAPPPSRRRRCDAEEMSSPTPPSGAPSHWLSPESLESLQRWCDVEHVPITSLRAVVGRLVLFSGGSENWHAPLPVGAGRRQSLQMFFKCLCELNE